MSLKIQYLVGKRVLIEDFSLKSYKIDEVKVLEKSSSGTYVKLYDGKEFVWLRSEQVVVYEVLPDLDKITT